MITLPGLIISLSILAVLFTVTPFIISGSRNWGVKSGMPSKKIGIIYSLGRFEAFMYRYDRISISKFESSIRSAGHTVTFADSPDEQQVINILNSNDIVFVLAHGVPDHYDENNKPLGAMRLGGTIVHGNENTVTDAITGVDNPLPKRWVTANELDGKVNNSNLEFVAAVCRLGRTNRMYRAIRSKSFIGLTGNGNSTSANACMRYVVDRLNGINFQAASNSFSSRTSLAAVNPTNADFP